MHMIAADLPAAPPLSMTRAADRSITLHTLRDDGPVTVGTFAGAAEAWRAVDALDMGLDLA